MCGLSRLGETRSGKWKGLGKGKKKPSARPRKSPGPGTPIPGPGRIGKRGFPVSRFRPNRESGSRGPGRESPQKLEMVHSNLKSIRTIPWVLASTQQPVSEAPCPQPHAGRHGMSPNALSRYRSAVELLAWSASDPGSAALWDTRPARFTSSLGCHRAYSKRAQRATV